MRRGYSALFFIAAVVFCATTTLANVPPLPNALGNGKSWTYDAAGNLISRRDAEGAETIYTYDNLNRVVSTEYPDATDVSFSYDAAGNLRTAANDDAALSFGYDPMNRVSAVTSSVFSVLSVVNYSYDDNGNRTALALPGNKTINYTYDAANRLETLNLSAFSISAFSFSYDDANRLTNIVYPNGVTAAYSYDAGGRPTGLTYTKSGSAFIDRAYTYNALGQITKRTISAGLEAVPPDTHQHLRHNAADQLTHVSRMDNYENPERWRDVGPGYDANGAVTNITAAYNGITLANAFTWDYEGRLVAYSGEHQTNLWFVAPPIPESLSFKYDALGGRVDRSAGPGGTKIHVLDQAAPLKNVLVQRASNGTIERYYIYAPGFGLGAHIDANGTARYYHGDHLGSTITLTDASGNVTDQFNYTPYGELMARTGSTDTPYTFCGRHGVYWEGGSLYHMKARYYRADLARFISPDPLGIAGGVNLYAYANGDPILFLDALGLCAESGGGWLRGAQTAGELGASMIPGVGEAMDVAVLFGRDSRWWERGLAVASLGVSVFTAGSTPNAGAAIRGAGRYSDEMAGGVASLLRRADDVPLRTPNEAGVVRQFVTESEQVYYRVFSDRPQGSFLTAVPPRSSAYAQEALALPRANTAEFIQEVTVPAGTTLRRSRAAPIQANDVFPSRRGGAEQFELLDRIPTGNFGAGRPLP